MGKRGGTTTPIVSGEGDSFQCSEYQLAPIPARYTSVIDTVA